MDTIRERKKREVGPVRRQYKLCRDEEEQQQGACPPPFSNSYQRTSRMAELNTRPKLVVKVHKEYSHHVRAHGCGSEREQQLSLSLRILRYLYR
jgi:hypothetical protein